MGRTFKAAWLGAAVLMVSACGEETKTTVTPDAGTVKPPGSIVAVASADPQFSTLVAAVEKAGLAETLADETKKYTVFAPTNAAFQALLTELGITNGLEGLTAAQLKPILLYHVLGSEVRAAAATTTAQSGAKVEALGGKVALSVIEGKIALDGAARVTAADVLASNGVIHVIDRVILPSIADIATTDPAFSSLATALTVADTDASKPGLVAALDDDKAKLTVFAPPNAAFDALVTALKGSDNGATTGISSLGSFTSAQLIPVLKYHVHGGGQVLGSQVPASAKLTMLGGKAAVAKGDKVTIDGAAVTTADILASNGVIHVIDQVMLPSITDIATTDPAFSSLATALTVADADPSKPGLVTALDDDKAKLTVFAPSNAAFDALVTALKGSDNGATTGISSLGSFSSAQLIPVLKYHVHGGGQVLASQVPAAAKLEMLGGKAAVAKGAKVTIDGAAVTTANILASNGAIHAIDRVVLPSITDLVTTSAQFSSLAGAIVAADGAQGATVSVAAALDGDAVFTLFAPTNAAFAALGAAPSGQALTEVLLYHAVGQAVYGATAAGLASPLSVSTALASKSLTVAASGAPGAVTVADGTAVKANVVATDYFTSNGVIHAVDKVLIP